MLAARSTRRAALGTLQRTSAAWGPAPRLLRPQWRHARTKATIGKDVIQTATPLAEALSRTGLWNYGRWATKDRPKKRPRGDKNRVNIVSEPLCDDVIKYMHSSLQRHVGCDIIDIYPGAGLWSSKLHEVLRPRSHILLEPDEDLYAPFLADLLAKPNTTLIPKSGIIWRDLSSVLDATHLPHQTERPAAATTAGGGGDDNPPQRNDTLLVTANLAFFPKRRFGIFESLTHLVIYQFINSIRASSLFHKYGLVRMLLWVESSDRHALLARSCQRRRRLAIDGELATDWITEVAGPDDYSQWFVRDHKLDMESCRRTLVRMQAAGIEIPAGRESRDVRELRLLGSAPDSAPDSMPPKPRRRGRPPKVADSVPDSAPDSVPDSVPPKPRRRGRPPKAAAETETKPETEPETRTETNAMAAAEIDLDALPAVFTRPFKEELRAMEAQLEAGVIAPKSAEHRRLLQLQYRSNRETKVAETVHEIMQQRDALAKACERGRIQKKTAAQREQAWNEKVDALSASSRKEFTLYRDNLHLFRQDPPVLSWDRRTVEPLVAQDTEFFPNAPCALLDIQPKAMHPLLRAMGPGSSRSGDMFELIMRAMLASGADPVSKAIELVWPGASEGVLRHCPSLHRSQAGGSPVGGPYGELSARTLNETQWVEILDAWMKWPFRPTLPQLVARTSEGSESDSDDDAVLD